MTAAKTKARARYAEHVAANQALLKEIGELIAAEAKRFEAKDCEDWGYVGNQGHVRAQLERVRAFLSGGES